MVFEEGILAILVPVVHVTGTVVKDLWLHDTWEFSTFSYMPDHLKNRIITYPIPRNATIKHCNIAWCPSVAGV